MTNLDTTAVVTLGYLETEGDHHVPFQGIETDQETEDIVNVIIHDLTPEGEIKGTEIKDLIVETIIDDEVVAEDFRQGLNHLQHQDTGRHLIGLPNIPKIHENLL